MNKYAKCQLYPPYGFCEKIVFCLFVVDVCFVCLGVFSLKNLPFMSPRQPIKLSDLGKRHM